MARPAPTFYVFHGTDELSRAETLADFRSRLGSADMADLNTTFLDGRKTSLAEMRHACDAIPFLAEKRLVIVEGLLARAAKQEKLLDELAEYLNQLPETTRSASDFRKNGTIRAIILFSNWRNRTRAVMPSDSTRRTQRRCLDGLQSAFASTAVRSSPRLRRNLLPSSAPTCGCSTRRWSSW